MIKYAILNAFQKKEQRGWEKYPRMYVAIDLHDVIIPGTYTRNNDGRKFYPFAEEVLQWLTNREDMCIILYTSSHQDAINDILAWLDKSGIKFDYVNENPECPNTELCDFTKSGKWYFDILLEDKAGFVGTWGWLEIKKTLLELGEWDKKKSHAEQL